jgi:hypothetical protein
MNLRKIVFAAVCTSLAAFGQVPGVTLDGVYQIRYASNLFSGVESFVNITNTGNVAAGFGLQAGTAASIPGAICVNVYAFTNDEQIVSCCSCPVTPNGLISLGVSKDLTNNPLTSRPPPASIVIKLVATIPTGGSCALSASGLSAGNLTPGMAAWGTTVHATSVTGTGPFSTTESSFTPATLSASELARLNTTCAFIQQQGSLAGLCGPCRTGGLGGAAQ